MICKSWLFWPVSFAWTWLSCRAPSS
jgi:hypothetical protein